MHLVDASACWVLTGQAHALGDAWGLGSFVVVFVVVVFSGGMGKGRGCI